MSNLTVICDIGVNIVTLSSVIRSTGIRAWLHGTMQEEDSEDHRTHSEYLMSLNT